MAGRPEIGIIDSFIFSSPSKIALCFWDMVLDKSIFLHIDPMLTFILLIMAGMELGSTTLVSA